jgi:hypothetical protein
LKHLFSISTLALACSLSIGAGAAQEAANATLGTPAALGLGARGAQASQSLGRIATQRIIRNASVGIGGFALRNRRDGAISISGVNRPVKAAYIYWAAITQGVPTGATSNIGLRLGGTGDNFTNIPGVVVGSGPQPCWSGDRITVYRGTIPSSIAVGNGFYRIRLRSGASGRTDGEDPWVSSPLPLFGGASIVIIGTGTDTVGLYDRGLAGKTFFPRLAYQLALPANARGSSQVVLHNIGADGQIGRGIDVIPATAREITTVGNGLRIAGPGSPTGESDWNGGIGKPLPQLWDTTSHNITSEVRRSDIGTVLPVAIDAPDDCLTPVANIVSIRPGT